MTAKKKPKRVTKKRISVNSYDVRNAGVGAELYLNGRRMGEVTSTALSIVNHIPRVLSIETVRKPVDLGFSLVE